MLQKKKPVRMDIRKDQDYAKKPNWSPKTGLCSGYHLISHKKFSLGYSLRTAIAKIENYPLEKTLKR
jgi:hypothetical protein